MDTELASPRAGCNAYRQARLRGKTPGMHRLVIVPRYGGHADSDWYPWLRDELFAGFPDLFTSVEVVEPEPRDAPDIERSVAALTEALDSGGAPTWLVGHSVGTQVVMRALAQHQDGFRAAGVLLVAPWFSIDEPWDDIVPWTDTPIDTSRARDAMGHTVALLSDDDPFTADYHGTRAELEARIGAEVRVVAGAAHFNAAMEPIVLGTLLSLRAMG